MRICLTVLILLANVTTPALGQSEPCECDRQTLLRNVRLAETIFYGAIQEANMDSRHSRVIALAVDIIDPIRGQERGRIDVKTTLPHACGVQAMIGNHTLFVISQPGEIITLCGGSGSNHYRAGHELDDLHNLLYAIVVVESAERESQVARSWLNRKFRKGRERREEMEDFFSLLGELDQSVLITISDDEVVYRNIVFVFDDDILVDYFWKEPS
ncbi:MAG: hypothetical protein AAF351_13560 [Pseudomonadota bacterium]